MTKQQQFFYDNAGYSWDPKKETEKQGRYNSARRYAKAEMQALRDGVTFQWEIDPNGCIGCDCGSSTCECSSGESHHTFYCIARTADGTDGASLHGICGLTPEYKRVIEAELASEIIN